MTYTHHEISIDGNTGKLSLESSKSDEDFEDIGMDQQVIYKCLGVSNNEDQWDLVEQEECCQAYRIVKSEGIDCGTCSKVVKEVWFKTDDDAKCSDCFE